MKHLYLALTATATTLLAAQSSAAPLTGVFEVTLDGGGDTTGDRFDNFDIPGTGTQDVAEQKGSGEELEFIDLELTVGSPVEGQLNQTNDGFGINGDSDVDTIGVEPGDSISFSFNFAVEISRFDFQDFDDGDSIDYTVGATTETILFSELDSTSSDDFTLTTAIALAANETITFSNVVNGSGETDGIAFDAFDIVVVPEPSSLALLGLGGLLIARRRRS